MTTSFRFKSKLHENAFVGTVIYMYGNLHGSAACEIVAGNDMTGWDERTLLNIAKVAKDYDPVLSTAGLARLLRKLTKHNNLMRGLNARSRAKQNSPTV